MNKLIKLIISTAITLLVLLNSTTSFAGNTNDIINQARMDRDEIAKAVSKTDFSELKKTSKQKMQNYQPIIEAIKNEHRERIKTIKIAKTKSDIGQQKPQAIFFVSFSMPDLSLKQIIYDASKYQIPVVIRGLYQNSFRKTLEKIFELVKDNNQGGIAISPQWFKEYDIKAVPAVVVSDDIENVENKYLSAKSEKSKKSDVVYGNIPLKKALSIIAERGTASNKAQSILDRANK